jgi:predicted metal-dependent hydrolase
MSELQRPAGVHVTYRRMHFEFEDAPFPRYWHGGSAFKSLFWTQLSTAFGPGEQFFIDSARALRDRIASPELREELAEFCRQEGHHTAQHLKFDRANEQLGIDIGSCRRRFERMLERARRRSSPLQMLAITTALEHFTAGFADQYFSQPELSAGSDPRVQALWAWHAAEEAEHRATCFDIYAQVGGSYPLRVAMMIGAWSLILWASLRNTLKLLHDDGRLFSRDTLRGFAYLFGRRGVVSGLLPAFFAYLNPRFHPWQEADGGTIARWQAENQRFIVSGGRAA